MFVDIFWGGYYEISKERDSTYLEFYRQGQKVDTLKRKLPQMH